MSKIAGIKNKSPETYPEGVPVPTVLETLRNVNAGPVSLTTAFAVIVAAPAFTPEVTAKATVMVSGVLQNASAAGPANVAIFSEGSPVYTVQVEVQTAGAPVPFSLTFEITGLTAHVTESIDVRAEMVSGTASAVDVSVVVIVTSA